MICLLNAKLAWDFELGEGLSTKCNKYHLFFIVAWLSRFELPMDHVVPRRACANPTDFHADEFLDELDIRLGLRWQFVKRLRPGRF